ncbi:GntR family transcriptional regulator [Flavihumibacter solisilvae]|jgi:DNA-binding transcriptional regulator YhcF (GntR family)|uniref:GntR family transcriptional regulator n=1 Tax=Flavihumibacter solisilvae TaxID=1349421 RepID=A0A0C1L518_9BACT|nr:GntR family transcriptional regulator [Flavihumibacter solisilvae]KIC90708.1 GntR family transcriptional regulator [Flavihumibacter solisilvae]
MQFNNNGQAIYLQIVDYICEKMLLGEYREEEKIPSVRELAVQLEVNPNTVARAYDFLKQQQIIFDKRGIGYFIGPDSKEIALEYRKKEFSEKELPALFRTMHMLGLSLPELEPAFESYKNKYAAA